MRRLTFGLWVLALTAALAFAQNAESRTGQSYLFIAPCGTHNFPRSTTVTLHLGGSEGFVYKRSGIGVEIEYSGYAWQPSQDVEP